MELKEMIKVMQHYENGGEVEYSTNNFNTIVGTANKKRVGDLTWDWGAFKYRIKEPKQEVIIEKWLCKSGENSFYIHEGTNADGLEKVKLLDTYEVEL